MAVYLSPEVESELTRCALCHDQCACACPLVQVSRRTMAYPSRLAQVALAAIRGEIPRDGLEDALSFCVDCGLCQVWCVHAGKDPAPPDIAGNLRTVRIALGLVTEPFVGDTVALEEQLDALTPRGEPTACFLPGEPAESLAAARLLNRLGVSWTAAASFPIAEWQDAGRVGQVKQKLLALSETLKSRQMLTVLAASPRDAWFLRVGLDAGVEYVGSFLAARWRERPRWSEPARFAFHPSAHLLRKSDAAALLDRWFSQTFGSAYIPLSGDANETLLPAGAESLGIGLAEKYVIGLAQQAWNQIAPSQPHIVLTTDPYSRAALAQVADPHTRIVDLLIYLDEML